MKRGGEGEKGRVDQWSLFNLLGVLDRKAPDIKVITQIVDDVDGEMSIGRSRKGQTAPKINVLHVRSKELLAIDVKKKNPPPKKETSKHFR